MELNEGQRDTSVSEFVVHTGDLWARKGELGTRWRDKG